mmetsp:Transcript_56889/g.77577  ORF Transcript_56889/g.77577 Transcript_56889/m.77577 type:complete len:83 (-) Transcript_56889:72-320(-)
MSRAGGRRGKRVGMGEERGGSDAESSVASAARTRAEFLKGRKLQQLRGRNIHTVVDECLLNPLLSVRFRTPSQGNYALPLAL